jgi:hypothetical protein
MYLDFDFVASDLRGALPLFPIPVSSSIVVGYRGQCVEEDVLVGGGGAAISTINPALADPLQEERASADLHGDATGARGRAR